MGIIDVNLDRPALKRAMGADESADDPDRAGEESATTPRRSRRILKTIGAITIGIVGLATVRRLRG